jgi:GDPmannose 4,6-dehydratase
VEAMWLILQQEKPEDFVIATGVTTTVREFIRMAFAEVGVEVAFTGEGVAEIGTVTNSSNEHIKPGRVVLRIDAEYFRPTEVELLIGNPAKANTVLGWKPKYDLAALCREMVASDIALFKNNGVYKIAY